MKPALTPEQWEEMLGPGPVGSDGGPPGFLRGRHRITDERAHGMAASCLYGQPFGFTRDMITALTHLTAVADNYARWKDEVALCRKAIANIKALLPPEEE